MKNAVVLWTGGKDSCLALHIAQEQNLSIVGLVTFVPVGNPLFRAHPQPEMEQQAKRLGLKVHFLEVREPYKESYIDKLKWVKSELGAATAVTGDIDYVGGCANWIVECCEQAELEVFRPLWQREREWVMEQLLARKIQARISFVSHSAIPPEWNGRLIDSKLLQELRAICKTNGIDLAGENGEYHTMVMAAPGMGEA
jgi:diphthine-ammonia ligase